MPPHKSTAVKLQMRLLCTGAPMAQGQQRYAEMAGIAGLPPQMMGYGMPPGGYFQPGGRGRGRGRGRHY